MTIPLAILWHQHQPNYRDTAAHELILPWVRLHAIKDYYGMARLLREFPEMRCAINLVPAMLEQLLDYVERQATDSFLRRTAIPAESLTADDAKFILDHFFMLQWDRMVRIYPRYRELLDLRRFGRRTAMQAVPDFRAQDLRDLQVWFTLAWFHPVCFQESETLRGLREKGRGFSEDDKALLLKEEQAVLARVVPLHRELAARGQVELTTTPYYHPILPLLCDMRSALVALPRAVLPAGHFRNSEDAEVHVARAVDFHQRLFGEAPKGMWPAEGAVSPEILPLLARHKIEWLATDEEILGGSLGQTLRGGFGRLDRPDLLFRPYRVQAEGGDLSMVFRDHQLSDLIGFQYQGWDGEAAAGDLLARVEAAARGQPAGPETLVCLILDGENCWEHYPEQGVKFLRNLYARLQERHKGVTPVRVRDFLAEHPPGRRLERLTSGSWIAHDFYIWVGHAEDRKAWEYVFRVREDLARETARRGGKPAGPPAGEDQRALLLAWEELYVAEGSDWFWWYGDDHTSGNDEAFDLLFRTHLKNVYRFLGLTPPFFLDDPIAIRRQAYYTPPRSVLNISLDGRVTSYFEWLGAGLYRSSRDNGVMAAAGPPLISRVYFGYSRDHLCLRADLHHTAPGEGQETPPAPAARRVTVLFAEPRGVSVRVDKGPPLEVHFEGAAAGQPATAEVAWDEVIELRVPFRALGAERGQELSFFVEATGADGEAERFPRAGGLQFLVPPLDIEERDWVV